MQASKIALPAICTEAFVRTAMQDLVNTMYLQQRKQRTNRNIKIL